MTVQQTESNHKKTLLWWKTLSAIAILNICLWLMANYYLHSQVGELSQYTSWHLSLSGVYVAACAFRSFCSSVCLKLLIRSNTLSQKILVLIAPRALFSSPRLQRFSCQGRFKRPWQGSEKHLSGQIWPGDGGSSQVWRSP